MHAEGFRMLQIEATTSGLLVMYFNKCKLAVIVQRSYWWIRLLWDWTLIFVYLQSPVRLSVSVFCFKGLGGKLVTFADPHKPKVWAREPSF